MFATVKKTDSARGITHRSRGHTDGPITRLVSPGDLGERIKPFVFLDWFDFRSSGRHGGFEYHPHSGIATLTMLLSGSVTYEDTTGKSGIMNSGGVEWMRAGRGVWHTGNALKDQLTRGFQLWIALPDALEMAPPESRYLTSADVSSDGPVRVLLGSYGKLRSSLSPGSTMNYLYVSLKDGERWVYQPPTDHDVAWVAVHEGELHYADARLGNEVAVFEEGHGALTFTAKGQTGFVLGSAPKHPSPLFLGPSSVHSSGERLKTALHEIYRIGDERKLTL